METRMQMTSISKNDAKTLEQSFFFCIWSVFYTTVRYISLLWRRPELWLEESGHAQGDATTIRSLLIPFRIQQIS